MSIQESINKGLTAAAFVATQTPAFKAKQQELSKAKQIANLEEKSKAQKRLATKAIKSEAGFEARKYDLKNYYETQKKLFDLSGDSKYLNRISKARRQAFENFAFDLEKMAYAKQRAASQNFAKNIQKENYSTSLGVITPGNPLYERIQEELINDKNTWFNHTWFN